MSRCSFRGTPPSPRARGPARRGWTTDAAGDKAAATTVAAGARPRAGGGGPDRLRPAPRRLRPPLRAPGVRPAGGGQGAALRPGRRLRPGRGGLPRLVVVPAEGADDRPHAEHRPGRHRPRPEGPAPGGGRPAGVARLPRWHRRLHRRRPRHRRRPVAAVEPRPLERRHLLRQGRVADHDGRLEGQPAAHRRRRHRARPGEGANRVHGAVPGVDVQAAGGLPHAAAGGSGDNRPRPRLPLRPTRRAGHHPHHPSYSTR